VPTEGCAGGLEQGGQTAVRLAVPRPDHPDDVVVRRDGGKRPRREGAVGAEEGDAQLAARNQGCQAVAAAGGSWAGAGRCRVVVFMNRPESASHFARAVYRFDAPHRTGKIRRDWLGSVSGATLARSREMRASHH
jgi:hypothetical protein